MSEVLIPPWILPQSESVTLLDETTSVFRSQYAPGLAQRVSLVEPRIQVKQSFKSLRLQERGAMLAVLARARGKFSTVRAIVGYSNRGNFPAFEMIPNGSFGFGTTGLTASQVGGATNPALSVTDRVLRMKITDGISTFISTFASSSSMVQFAAYCARGFFLGSATSNASLQVVAIRGVDSTTSNSVTSGLVVAAAVATQTQMTLDVRQVNAGFPGDGIDIAWTSLARCALVDNGVNQFLNSDTPGGTSWTSNHATGASNSSFAPDGVSTAYKITEDATTNNHFVQTSSVSVSSGIVDVTGSIYVAPGGIRTKCWLQLVDGSGNTQTQWFDLSAKTLLSAASSGTGMIEPRASIADFGNGWVRITLTCKKISAATIFGMLIGPTTTDGITSYLGSTASSALLVWRAAGTGAGQVGCPIRAVQTTTAVVLGTSQTGNSLYLKGLPANTAGLLLPGDAFEVGGELKMVSRQLDSDGQGLGRVIFHPALCRSPADSDPVIIFQPMGKFILADNPAWDNQFGVYADVDISLEAINE